MRLILASSSPRRRELLSGLGLQFTIRAVGVDEEPNPGEEPAALVERLALDKARASAVNTPPLAAQEAEVVIAADTVAVIDGLILGKPRDAAEAIAMLNRLAGREHTVLTGVAVRGPDRREVVAVDRSRVFIAAMSPAQVAWYVATGEPMDKAGAYAIQGIGALLVTAIDGNYTNVVGLPLPTLAALVAQLGLDLMDFRQ